MLIYCQGQFAFWTKITLVRVQTKVSIDFLLFTVFQFRLDHSNSFRLVLVISLQCRCCYFFCLFERSIFSLVIADLQWFKFLIATLQHEYADWLIPAVIIAIQTRCSSDFWCRLTELGISRVKPTRRGCCGGRRKFRILPQQQTLQSDSSGDDLIFLDTPLQEEPSVTKVLSQCSQSRRSGRYS